MARRLTRVLALILLVGSLSVAAVSPAGACSCVAMGDGDLFLLAEAVFTGRAIKPSANDAEWRFEVEDVYKGAVYQVQIVHTGVGSCAYTFDADERYQVFADADGDILWTDKCRGTRSLASAPVFAPTTAAQPESGSADDDGTPIWLIATDVLMVLVALFAVVFGPRILRNRKRDGP